MSDRGRPPSELYACPRCHRVAPGLVEVAYATGRGEERSEIMCDACFAQLHELAAGAQVWAIEILRRIGGDREPVRASAAPRRPLHELAPRRTRAARGGVEV